MGWPRRKRSCIHQQHKKSFTICNHKRSYTNTRQYALGKICAHGFDEAMRVTRAGIFEYQVVAACDFVYENEGAQCPAYFPIAASGERGLSWHYNANNHAMKDGDVILVDYAPELNYYTTDITRTWPVGGKFTDIQLKFYNCIKE